MYFFLCITIPCGAYASFQAPKLSWENIKTLIPIALMHAMAHMTAVISLNAGAVSFTHIVKAAEPAFTSLFAALFLKQYFAAPVYLSLIPVMAGVGIASLKERSFRSVEGTDKKKIKIKHRLLHTTTLLSDSCLLSSPICVVLISMNMSSPIVA